VIVPPTLENLSGRPTIFVSHCREDLELAQRLKAALREAGIQVYDVESELPQQPNLADHVREVIGRRAVGALVLLSQNYHASRWCEFELSESLGAYKDEKRAFILMPIRLDEEPVPDNLFAIAVDGRKLTPGDIAALILRRLRDRDAVLLSQLSDEDLYQRYYETRDEVVAKLLFERIIPIIRFTCFAQLRGIQERSGTLAYDAEDIFHEIIRMFVTRPPVYKPEVRDSAALGQQGFHLWLKRLVNWTVSRYKHRALIHTRARDIGSLPEEPASSPTPRDAADSSDSLRQMTEAISKLTENDRILVNLIYAEGLSSGEVAQRLSIPISQVHARRHRILASLKKNIETQEWEP
jgi:RNA polymerase sigma factor (sigma-70 family)